MLKSLWQFQLQQVCWADYDRIVAFMESFFQDFVTSWQKCTDVSQVHVYWSHLAKSVCGTLLFFKNAHTLFGFSFFSCFDQDGDSSSLSKLTDMFAILLDLWCSEVSFQEQKMKVNHFYAHVCVHTIDIW